MELRLEARRTAVGAARHWVVGRARADGVPGPVVEVVELLTSELVANAVVHGPPDGRITVRASAGGGRFTVSVTDESTDTPVPRRTAPEVPGGHGLRLVERLADGWGIDLHSGGKSVWFAVAT